MPSRKTNLYIFLHFQQLDSKYQLHTYILFLARQDMRSSDMDTYGFIQDGVRLRCAMTDGKVRLQRAKGSKYENETS